MRLQVAVAKEMLHNSVVGTDVGSDHDLIELVHKSITFDRWSKFVTEEVFYQAVL